MTHSALLTLAVIIVTVATAPSAHAEIPDRLTTTSPREHEAVRASVINPEPDAYTIDIKTLANISVDDDAPTFAVYVTRRLPDTCGDFRKLELPYTRPGKYKRQFDLSRHQDVIRALEEYGCVVMRNIPSKS